MLALEKTDSCMMKKIMAIARVASVSQRGIDFTPPMQFAVLQVFT